MNLRIINLRKEEKDVKKAEREEATVVEGYWYKSTKRGVQKSEFNIYYVDKMLNSGDQRVTGLDCYGKWVNKVKRDIRSFENYLATKEEVRLAKRQRK